MATILLGAVGASIGGSLGGSILGLSGAVLGRAVGATVGRVVDQAVLGRGSETIEQGRLDRFRLTGASEGTPIPRVQGRMRLGGQVIWATRFKETYTETSGGGKGGPPKTTVREYTYSVSVAMALCEGPVRGIGRIWADGTEIARSSLSISVHLGHEDQLPDAYMEAIDGVGQVPAYRGLAYVVIECLDLAPFGNRMPQMSFEIIRDASSPSQEASAAERIQGVAIVPGTGEYALSTTPVHFNYGGERDSANVNTVSGYSDFRTALTQLRDEVPRLKSASLVVSWFGNDLRCGSCEIKPLVEQTAFDGNPQPWIVSGLERADANIVPVVDGRPVYGGTPSDISVVEAIREMREKGIDITFYPFILMTQRAGNALPDPYGRDEQPALPWRGRITTSLGPYEDGSPDGSVAARDEVRAFFGDAEVGAFGAALESGGRLRLPGPEGWSYRRFILHYAKLCAHAGGVEAFCIGSEMRSLTQIRGEDGTFPSVEELRRLAAEVRVILPDAKIGYAADWSEYFGYHPSDTGDVHFHLDPLWSDDAIDFVGIDNYMPLSDWRDGIEHLDAWAGSIGNMDYLRGNIEGGEGFDWYYPTPEARLAQRRTPITDGAYGEDWIFRNKDIRSWWTQSHHDRIGGLRATDPTDWVPMSKPIRFTEYGCAAVDKGSNQPNKFVDPKSSESALPYFSNGRRDDRVQMQYLRAFEGYWSDAGINPTSPVYAGPMVDMERSLVWAWDARPYPAFPELSDYWSDGENHDRGHWLSGRSGVQPLATVVAELCDRAGLTDYDVSALDGVVRGYAPSGVQSARADLQPILVALGVDVFERNGLLTFTMRGGDRVADVETDLLVRGDEAVVTETRAPGSESAGQIKLTHVEAGGEYGIAVADAIRAGSRTLPVQDTEYPVALTRGEGHALAERLLAETEIGRDQLDVVLPPSRRDLNPGDTFRLDGGDDIWRIDSLRETDARQVRALRVEPHTYEPSDIVEDGSGRVRPLAPLPVDAVFLDLPLLTGEEVAHAPYVAIAGRPWPGSVALHRSIDGTNYRRHLIVEGPSMVGQTLSTLDWARPDQVDRGGDLLVKVANGELSSATEAALLAGANVVAIGGETSEDWELLQYGEARLVAPETWALSQRLRGQRGSDSRMRSAWPIGSTAVFLDGRPEQLDLALEEVGLERTYRYGPAADSLDSDSYVEETLALGGEGLRPYAPVHLQVDRSDGRISVNWIRRSRTPGDGWGAGDVPLSETRERYRVHAFDAEHVEVRSWVVDDPELTISDSDWAAILGAGAVRLAVAQESELLGPGHARSITIAQRGLK